MSIIRLSAVAGEDPTPSELAAIEQEWPRIAAELDLLDAQIAYDNAGPSPSVLDRRRVRRAERRVMAVSRELADHDAVSEVVA
jgi:cob(I)alamin adenosyltransferase